MMNENPWLTQEQDFPSHESIQKQIEFLLNYTIFKTEIKLFQQADKSGKFLSKRNSLLRLINTIDKKPTPYLLLHCKRKSLPQQEKEICLPRQI